MSVEGSIEIDAPVDKVYALYMDLEGLPRLIEPLRKVERISDTLTVWTWNRVPEPVRVEVVLVSARRNQRVEWKIERDAFPCKAVTEFHALDGNRTRVVHRSEHDFGVFLCVSQQFILLAKRVTDEALRAMAKWAEATADEPLQRSRELTGAAAG
ncbi:SRPBCC family protein [Streptomyces sp. NPDC048337]|uniref:SRPBCC family protein n=1 Tax=Streptomyces sp. NPDC048337 TaxID=3365535 RepID=UPI00372403AC